MIVWPAVINLEDKYFLKGINEIILEPQILLHRISVTADLIKLAFVFQGRIEQQDIEDVTQSKGTQNS